MLCGLHGRALQNKVWTVTNARSLPPWPQGSASPKQRKNHHHVPWPDALTQISKSHVPRAFCAPVLVCVRLTWAPTRLAAQAHPTPHTICFYASVSKGRTPTPIPTPPSYQLGSCGEDGLWSQSPGSRPGSTPSQLGTHKMQLPVHLLERGDGGRRREATLVAGIAWAAWSPPSWFSLASGHVPLIRWVTFMKVLQKLTWQLYICRVLRYYYLCPKY